MLVDGRGRPLVVLVSPGQAHDSPMYGPLIASIWVPRVGPAGPAPGPTR